MILNDIAEQTNDPKQRLVTLLQRLSMSNESRVARGCPIYAAIHQFKSDAPAASARAGETFSLLIGWIARERQQLGNTQETALADARQALINWQGAIALAHALGNKAALDEAFATMRGELTA